jgi:PAS domain-containing protein
MRHLPAPLDLLRRRVRANAGIERELLRVVLERTGAPIVAFDRSAVVTHSSKGARTIFGEASAVGASPRLWVELLEPCTREGLVLSVADLPQVRVATGRGAPSYELVVQTDVGPRSLRPLVDTLNASRRSADPAIVVHFVPLGGGGESR